MVISAQRGSDEGRSVCVCVVGAGGGGGERGSVSCRTVKYHQSCQHTHQITSREREVDRDRQTDRDLLVYLAAPDIKTK